MQPSRSQVLREGVVLGVAAGIIFALVEIIASAMMGNPAVMPIRMFASVALGKSALMTAALGEVIVVGLVVHVALSALFGLVYGGLNAMFSQETRASYGRQAIIGLLFGAALWFVNFQIIARQFYPWFLESPQLLQAMMHSVAFGLPLGLMVAAAERRS